MVSFARALANRMRADCCDSLALSSTTKMVRVLTSSPIPKVRSPNTTATACGVRRLVLSNAEANEIKRVAVENGMRTMFEDGIRKALAGVTTIDEVLRSTRDT